MCGIAIQINNGEQNPDYTREMIKTMAHRGFSDIHYSRGNVNISFRWLPIANPEISQPYIYKEVAVFIVGEIYNYKELGYQTEAECLSVGFYNYGKDFVKKLNGAFVLAVFIGDEFIMAADRFGQKFLYLKFIECDSVLLSSEIKSFEVLKTNKHIINPSYSKSFLSYQNFFESNSTTIFRGIYKITNSYLSYETIRHTFISSKIYDFNPYNLVRKIPYSRAVKKVRQLVEKAILSRKHETLPNALCLSGGIDSTIIYYVLNKDVKTYTLNVDGLDDYEIAKKTNPDTIEVNGNELQYFDETIKALENLKLGASWGNYLMYKIIDETIIFDGAGADELFMGYTWRYDMNTKYQDILDRSKLGIELPKIGHDSERERLEFDYEHFLTGVLEVTEKLAMANTKELRTPFCDNDLWDYVLKLPLEYRYNKRILKDAFSDILPDYILNKKKTGFSTPDVFSYMNGNNKAHNWSLAALDKWKSIFLNNERS